MATFANIVAKLAKKKEQHCNQKLRLENGAKECIVQISARAFQRIP